MARHLRTSCSNLLLPLLFLLALPAVAQAQDYTYTTNDGAITITGYTGSGGEVTIPSAINGLPVTCIGWQAFYSCTSLASMTIPNTVTSIGGWAFRSCTSLTNVTVGNSITKIGSYAFYSCTSLTSLSIPNSVTSIEDGAFGSCSSLTSFTIPDSVTNIGVWTFQYCTSLTNVTIGNSVSNIGTNAFYSCSGLTSVTIPNSVTSIGELAFFSCTSLTSVTIPNSVTSIGDLAFYSCTSLTAITVDGFNPFYSSVDGVLFNKNQTTLIQCPAGKAEIYPLPNSLTVIADHAFSYCNKLAILAIPNSVNSIGPAAFWFCTSLTNVTIPDSVTSIGSGAFQECTSLANVAIPASVTSIGGGAFLYCSSLTAITADRLNPFYGSLEGVLFDKSQTTLIQCPGRKAGAYTIPNSVTSIVDQAFDSCTNLTSVTIPKSVTSVARAGFYSCTGLTAFTVDALNPMYSSVDGVLFNKNQTALIQYPAGKAGTDYMILNSVTNIGNSAFRSCTSLTNVTIPNGITSIGQGAFLFCTSLTAISVAALNPAYSSADGVLFNKSKTTLIQCPAGKAGTYAIPGSVSRIGDSAFRDCTGLTSVTIPKSVTGIGIAAFYSCTSLAAITVDGFNFFYSSVDGVLFNKNQTTLIQCPAGKAGTSTIPGSVTSISNVAFRDCTNLTGIYFRGNAPSLGSSVFLGDNNMIVYYLPGSKGWSKTFGGIPTALWKPLMQTTDASFGMLTNQFGFNITWASGTFVVVEACTNLANPTWVPVATNVLSDDTFYFSDPQWTNYPTRLYHLRSP